MSIKAFRQFLVRALRRLNKAKEHFEFVTTVDHVFMAAGRIAEQLGIQAAELGLDDLVAKAAELEGMAEPDAVRVLVAKAIGACDERMGDGPFTAAETAKILTLGTRTVYDLEAAGKLNGERHGKGRGTLRFTQADIEAYRQQTRGTPALQTTDAKRKRLLRLA